ncbi:MAG TPA: hypothetical protein VLX92_05510, partial [Kofleriaceae bacterium]|nr:hypothetical protein [Kofleriaceae bacterium]
PGPKVETPGPKVETPGPKVETPGPKVETPGPKVETPGPKVETPPPKLEGPPPKIETPAPKTETTTPTPSEQPLVPKAPDAPVPPGFRAEPSLKNAGWGPRPEGGEQGAEYAEQATHSKESLYVFGLQDELGGTGVVELDGEENQILLDAKDAGPKSMYDVTGTDKFTQNVKIPKVLAEATRQGWAMIRSGAKGIEWRVSNEAVANGLRRLFADRGVKITVTFVAKTAKPPVVP